LLAGLSFLSPFAIRDIAAELPPIVAPAFLLSLLASPRGLGRQLLPVSRENEMLGRLAMCPAAMKLANRRVHPLGLGECML
jgi:hypothetical protein